MPAVISLINNIPYQIILLS